ncbi:MAG: hypothetical protein Kow0092_36090 [Deferrisomatales bacterium]
MAFVPASSAGFPRRSPRRAGFTLVEALISVAVFCLGMAALMPLAVSIVRANHAASVRTAAVALAQQKAEELRTVPYDDLAVLTPGSASSPPYTVTWTTIPVADPGGDGGDLMRLRVAVGWDLGSRGAGSAELVVSRARY